MKRIVVGFSGGVTSAWCAGWAKRTFPNDRVILLWHDTKEEHPDTYRFLHEMAARLELPITERSDGRSVTEVFRDEGFLGNNQNAMCSRIMKRDQGDRFISECHSELLAEWYPGWPATSTPFRDVEDIARRSEDAKDLVARLWLSVVMVFGFSANEPDRVQRAAARGMANGFTARFPLIEENVSKQQAADWCSCTMGVRPSAMYAWSGHANCVGCVKGGKEYWLAVAENAPEVFAQRVALEEEFGHGILRGGGREHHLLKDLVQIGMKRRAPRREAIEIGPCECGD